MHRIYERLGLNSNDSSEKLLEQLKRRKEITLVKLELVADNDKKELELQAELKNIEVAIKMIKRQAEHADDADSKSEIGNFDIAILTEDAQHGDAHAQYELGVCFYSGNGVAQSYEKAVAWYSKAAKQGYAHAQDSLGDCYYKGNGVAQSYEKAVAWYSKAAKQGYAHAQDNLGDCYYNGNGIKKSCTKAVEWYAKAAEQGYTRAQSNLGYCYSNGEGIVQSYEKAVAWYSKAAEQGRANAQYNLGIYYYEGKGVIQNYEKAVEWFTKAAEQGYVKAQDRLGECYYKGKGVAQNYEKAVEWFANAAEQGYANAQNNLGKCYYSGDGVEHSYEKALDWYTKAAEQGHKKSADKVIELIIKLRPDLIAKRGKGWGLLHSWYILLAFVYPMSYLSFFFIGFRTSCLKWKIAGLIYTILLLYPSTGINNIGYFAAIIHAFVCRREYLVRLDICQSKKAEKSNQASDGPIEKKYDPNKAKIDRIVEPGARAIGASMSNSDFVQKIRELNVIITDKTVSKHLDNIELVLTKIFEYIERHPEKLNDIRTLNNYYMPEIIKLLERYIELSNNPMKNHGITVAMAEIESVLIIITEALQNLYNNLFKDITSEISTDIKVLKDIFVQNGLTEGKNELKL